MSGLEPAGEPEECAATGTRPEQHTITSNGSLANVITESSPAKDLPVNDYTAGFDMESAAKKLKCDGDPDAVSSAIGILFDELEDRDKKIAWFERLFGYRAEDLMEYQEHFLRYEDIKFYGQMRLQGKTLQQAMRREHGVEPSLAELEGKSVVHNVQEDHYDFAVVLPVKAKELVDRELNKLRAEGAKTTIQDSIAAAVEDADPDLPAKVLADKKALEEEKLHTTLAQDQVYAGQRAAEEMFSDPQSTTAHATARNAPIEEDRARTEDKERKRKRAIISSDDEDNDQENGLAKMSKVG